MPAELALKAQKFTVPCIEETNANPEILRKVLDSTLENDDVSKKFLYCFGLKGNFTDEEGHFNISRMSGLLGDHPLVKSFEEALAECNKITKETPVETAFAMNSCLNNNAPVVFAL
ncbi:general odorant-binding protein 57c-like [Epargyreus clarus]|uniref:general odorant-binding protein 57c-like n=1 Tax=Epargyreus clarus TaxID=520877 RepID=UPI003C2F7FC5